MVIQVKKPAPTPGRNPSLPAPYKKVAENPHGSVFELTVEPGGKIAKHTHSDYVTVSLTDATAESTDEQGKKQTTNFKKDTATFRGPATHLGVNTGQTPLHLITAELK